MATLEGSYNGLSFGTGTDYHVSGVEGLWDLPPVRSNDLAKAAAFGSFPGRDRLDEKVVILNLTLIAATPAAYDTLVFDLIDATQTGSGDNLLTANQASIETDASGWGLASNATLARSTAQAADGVASLSLTAGAAGDMWSYSDPRTALVGGRRYTALASFRGATAGKSVDVSIQWQNAAGGVLGNSQGAAVTDTTTGWTQASVTATAPDGTTQGRVAVAVRGAAAGEVHYADKIAVHQGRTTIWTAGDKFGGIERPLRLMGNTVYINARPRRRIIPIATDRQQRYGEAVVEFVSTDPNVYTGAP